MTDQFSRDHYRDSRQPGENSSRRRVNANPNHRTAGNNARHVSSSRRPAGTRQQTSAHQQGAPRPRSASQAGANPRRTAPPRRILASKCGRVRLRAIMPAHRRVAPLPRERATRIVQSLSARRRTETTRPTPPSTTTTPATPSAARSAPVLLPSALWRCLSSPSALACSLF